MAECAVCKKQVPDGKGVGYDEPRTSCICWECYQSDKEYASAVEERVRLALSYVRMGRGGLRAEAKRIGVSPATLNWVRLTGICNLEIFARLCHHYNLDANEILNPTVNETR